MRKHIGARNQVFDGGAGLISPHNYVLAPILTIAYKIDWPPRNTVVSSNRSIPCGGSVLYSSTVDILPAYQYKRAFVARLTPSYLFNYFILVRCYFRIGPEAHTNIIMNYECSKYLQANRSLPVLHRIASLNIVSMCVSSHWFVSPHCTFLSIRSGFTLACFSWLLRFNILQYDVQRWNDQTTLSWISQVRFFRISSYQFLLVLIASTFPNRIASYCIVSDGSC